MMSIIHKALNDAPKKDGYVQGRADPQAAISNMIELLKNAKAPHDDASAAALMAQIMEQAFSMIPQRVAASKPFNEMTFEEQQEFLKKTCVATTKAATDAGIPESETASLRDFAQRGDEAFS